VERKRSGEFQSEIGPGQYADQGPSRSIKVLNGAPGPWRDSKLLSPTGKALAENREEWRTIKSCILHDFGAADIAFRPIAR